MPPAPVDLPGIAAAWARVSEIQGQLATPAAAATTAPGGFANALSSAQAVPTTGGGQVAAEYLPSVGALGAATPLAGGATGQRIAAIATAELGVAEQPPGSNDGPRIADYRTATAGAGRGPWCAYFASWVAAQAGAPIGPNGSGLGYVPSVQAWAQSTGRAVPGTATPQVGDLAVFDRNGDGTLDHIGVVTSVAADGSFGTVEGNSSDAVSSRGYRPGGASGFVRLTAPGQ